jgi:transcriptional regulator with XRE-family HTH domain
MSIIVNKEGLFVKPNNQAVGANKMTEGAAGAAGGPGAANATSPRLIGQIAAAIRRERRRAGLSLTELARRAGIAKSTLSQLESGSGNPSVETLWALGVALGVPFSRLVEPARQAVQVIRAGQGPVIYSERASYAATLLATSPPGARRDIYRVVIQPGEPFLSDPHPAGTTEHLVLSTGRALAGPVGEAAELGPGDYLTYPGDVTHIFSALEPDSSGVMVVESI